MPLRSAPSARPLAPDFWRTLARVWCFVFGLLGALPLGAGFVARSELAQAWLSFETSRLLRESLELTATYNVSLSLWPLQIAIEGLRVPGEDGLGPAITAKRIAITPRLFSLMAGRVDIGDIEIRGARLRLVSTDGRISNLHVRVPEVQQEAPAAAPTRSPFRTFSASDLELDLTLDGMRVAAQSVDLDVFSEGGLAFEATLGVGETQIDYPKDFFVHGYTYDVLRPAFGPQQLSQWEQDRICQASVRARLTPEGILVRSLELRGVADTDEFAGSSVRCPNTEAERRAPNVVDIRAHQLRVEPPAQGRPLFLHGQLRATVPTNLINRVTDVAGPFDGPATVDGTIDYDGRTRLPEFSGKLTTGDFKIDEHRITESSEGQVELRGDRIHVPEIHIRYGGGMVDITDVTIALFEPGVPLTSKRVEGSDVRFPYLIRDVRITPNTIVNWNLKRTRVTDFKGTLDPPRLAGDMHVETTDFEIFDRSYRDPHREHLFGVLPPATLSGRFGLSFQGLEFNNVHTRFGASEFRTTVHIGFNHTLLVDFREGKLDLAEMSPIVSIPMSGIATLEAKGEGPLTNTQILGKLSIRDFNFGGFPLGDISPTNVKFKPLWFELSGGTLTKGRSVYQIPTARFEFRKEATVAVRAQVSTRQSSARDFLKLWNLDADPRWADLSGTVKADAEVTYTFGGPRDPCRSGNLHVRAGLSAENVDLFGQHYDTASTDLSLLWEDMDASYHGMTVDLGSIRMTKRSGSILGSAQIRPGGALSGNFVATALPIRELQGFGSLGELMSGTVSAVAHVGGTLDQMEADARATISPVIVGRSRYPGSSLVVRLEPTKTIAVGSATTGCNRPIPLPTTPEDLAADRSQGVFHIDGELFGNQMQLDDFTITRQNHKRAAGGITFDEFELGPLLENLPNVLDDDKPLGRVSAKVRIDHWPFDEPSQSAGQLQLSKLWLAAGGYKLTAKSAEPIAVKGGRLSVPKSTIEVTTPLGPAATFTTAGSLSRLGTNPAIDAQVELHPLELQSWHVVSSELERLAGTVEGAVQISGSLAKPSYRGGIRLRNGALGFNASSLTLTNVSADLTLENSLLSLTNASAAVGGGTLIARGQAPLRGFKLGRFEGSLLARDVTTTLPNDIQTTFSADLEATWAGFADDAPATLPKIVGTVNVANFTYTHPIALSADITEFARRAKPTEFESYDPSQDFAEIDVQIVSEAPFLLHNNLIDASLALDRGGLQLTGTNQRFGLRGRMEVNRGGRIQLRRNEFAIQSGEVRFDDTTTIAPRVDVTAVTEYRRYSSSTSGAVSASDTTAATGGTGPGQWRIKLRAHGDADDLKIDLTSDPSLSQDDIFLLLTVGLTRAELDRAQSAGMGQSVALEALGSLTGAGNAFSEVIPLFDDFSLGSAYSPKTGRSEPTITVGKRLSQRLRAYVTKSLGAASDIRSNVELKVSPQVSVQGSFDNMDDYSATTAAGNLGADVRWRLEFR